MAIMAIYGILKQIQKKAKRDSPYGAPRDDLRDPDFHRSRTGTSKQAGRRAGKQASDRQVENYEKRA